MAARPASVPFRASRLGAAWARLNGLVHRGFLASDRTVLAVLAAATVAVGGVAGLLPSLVPLVLLPVLAGGLFLRVRSLAALLCAVGAAILYDALRLGTSRVGFGITATIAVTATVALFMSRIRGQLGVQGFRGEWMLVELRDRLRTQGELPKLPPGWEAEVVLGSAGSSFGGDFVVSTLTGDRRRLEVALVDVSGKGIDAGTRALLLSGAFGGLLGAMPMEELLPAANAYLLRQGWEEGFATAVHVEVDLLTGHYAMESAGHPPAVHFEAGSGTWRVTKTEGSVLGVLPEVSFCREEGVLRRGDALLLYTDGLIEVPGRDLEDGIDRLLGEAERLVTCGFRDGARKLVEAASSQHEDDRALVLIWRS